MFFIMLLFLPYEEKYKPILQQLTLEWLEKYVSVEQEDLDFIHNPKKYALDKGGHIFFAEYNNEIVETVSLFRTTDYEFELGKLALTEKYKGLKFGKQIMQLGLDRSRELGAKRIILYTSKRLVAAYNLYLKLGFIEIHQEKQKYIEAEVKMALDL